MRILQIQTHHKYTSASGMKTKCCFWSNWMAGNLCLPGLVLIWETWHISKISPMTYPWKIPKGPFTKSFCLGISCFLWGFGGSLGYFPRCVGKSSVYNFQYIIRILLGFSYLNLSTLPMFIPKSWQSIDESGVFFFAGSQLESPFGKIEIEVLSVWPRLIAKKGPTVCFWLCLYVSHQRKELVTFHHTGRLIGILIMVYCNPHLTELRSRIPYIP